MTLCLYSPAEVSIATSVTRGQEESDGSHQQPSGCAHQPGGKPHTQSIFSDSIQFFPIPSVCLDHRIVSASSISTRKFVVVIMTSCQMGKCLCMLCTSSIENLSCVYPCKCCMLCACYSRNYLILIDLHSRPSASKIA